MVDKAGRHHFNKVIKVNVHTHTHTHGINWHYVPTAMMHWEGHSIASLVFLPKMYHLNTIVRNYQTKPNWSPFNNITNF